MRATHGLSVLCVLVTLVSVAAAEGDHDPKVRAIGHGCGAVSAAVFARRVAGSNFSFEQAQLATDPDGDGVCSIADLLRALQGIGLDVRAHARASKSLPRVPAILWVATSPAEGAPYDHFIVTEPGPRGRFVVHYPPFGSSIQDESSVTRVWSGRYVALQNEAGFGWRYSIGFLILGALTLLIVLRLRRAA